LSVKYYAELLAYDHFKKGGLHYLIPIKVFYKKQSLLLTLLVKAFMSKHGLFIFNFLYPVQRYNVIN